MAAPHLLTNNIVIFICCRRKFSIPTFSSDAYRMGFGDMKIIYVIFCSLLYFMGLIFIFFLFLILCSREILKLKIVFLRCQLGKLYC